MYRTFLIILVILILSSSCHKSEKPGSLKSEYDSLKSWPVEGDLSKREWNNYIRVAKLIQQTSPESVSQSMDNYLSDLTIEDFRDDYESKIFLLLRVVFELPEEAPQEELRSFKGWNNWGSADLDQERVNLSWPIIWYEGKPVLVDNYSGSEGLPYSASSEYEHFLKNYPFRNL